jgi:hypothetical protein
MCLVYRALCPFLWSPCALGEASLAPPHLTFSYTLGCRMVHAFRASTSGLCTCCGRRPLRPRCDIILPGPLSDPCAMLHLT